MKALKVLMLCCAVVFIGACSNSNDNDDDDNDQVTEIPDFSTFTRDVFSQSANSEPKKVSLGVTFKISESDGSADFNDLIQ